MRTKMIEALYYNPSICFLGTSNKKSKAINNQRSKRDQWMKLHTSLEVVQKVKSKEKVIQINHGATFSEIKCLNSW